MKYDIGAVPEPKDIGKTEQEKKKNLSRIGAADLNRKPQEPKKEEYVMKWLERIKEKREKEKREQKQQKQEEAQKTASIFKGGYTPGYAKREKLEKTLVESHLKTRPDIKPYALKGSIEKQHQLFKSYFPKAGERKFFKPEDVKIRIKELQKEAVNVSGSRLKEIRKQIAALKKVA